LAHIERKTEEVWRSIDDLQKAVEAIPPAEQSTALL
jgi:carbon monoxide dehydrogenase subunit G